MDLATGHGSQRLLGGLTRRDLLAAGAIGLAGGTLPANAAPQGQLTVAVHVSLTPTWFDPAESTGIITPYMLLYAMHDGIVKAMPGNIQTPSASRP